MPRSGRHRGTEILAEQQRREAARAAAQAELDAEWSRLLANDPPRVMEALEALNDNETPVVPIDCNVAPGPANLARHDRGRAPPER